MSVPDNDPSQQTATLDDFCRLCLRQCGTQWMRPWRDLSSDIESTSIADMLVYCCGLPSLLNDDLPQRICFPCISRLEQVYAICRFFKEKETILNRFFSNGSLLEKLIQYETFRFIKEEKITHENETDSPTEDISANESTQIDETALNEVTLLCEVEPECKPLTSPTTENSNDEHSIANSMPEAYNQPISDSDNSSRLRKPGRIKKKYSRKSAPIIPPSQRTHGKVQRVEYIPELDKILKVQRRRRQLNRENPVPVAPNSDGYFHCTYCTHKFPQRRNCVEHIAKHRALLDQRYKCPVCDKLFCKRDHLIRHLFCHQQGN